MFYRASIIFDWIYNGYYCNNGYTWDFNWASPAFLKALLACSYDLAFLKQFPIKRENAKQV